MDCRERQEKMVGSQKKMVCYLQCPQCGEFHEYDLSGKSEKLVCLYCEEVFSTDDFQPYAIAYRKTIQSVRPL